MSLENSKLFIAAEAMNELEMEIIDKHAEQCYSRFCIGVAAKAPDKALAPDWQTLLTDPEYQPVLDGFRLVAGYVMQVVHEATMDPVEKENYNY